MPFSLVGGAALGRGPRRAADPARRSAAPSTGSSRSPTAGCPPRPSTASATGCARRPARRPSPAPEPQPSPALLAALRAGDATALAGALANDLQAGGALAAPRARRDPARRRATAGALAALVSGSGPDLRLPGQGRRSGTPSRRPRPRAPAAGPRGAARRRARRSGVSRSGRGAGARSPCAASVQPHHRLDRPPPGRPGSQAPRDPGAPRRVRRPEPQRARQHGAQWPSTSSTSKPSARCTAPVPCSTASPSASSEGDRIGVVGRNGDGKTTLIRMLAKLEEPDAGRVTHIGGLRLGVLTQHDSLDPAATVRHEVIGDLRRPRVGRRRQDPRRADRPVRRAATCPASPRAWTPSSARCPAASGAGSRWPSC